MFQNINDLVQCEKCQAKILEKAWEIHRIMCDKQSKAARPSSIKVSEIKKEDLIPCEQCGQNICFDVYEFHE
jgi:DNA-directed RNA polymerase subunit RPC12/RpoP